MKSIENKILTVKKSQVLLRTQQKTNKNKFLLLLAQLVEDQQEQLLTENQKDIQRLPASTSPAFRDRLTLTPDRIFHMSKSLQQVAAWPDPVDEIIDERTLKNGLKIKRVRAPIGVILMIFESRPNVILEAFSIAFKSGNCIVLRGGSEAAHTARLIYRLIADAHKLCGFSFHSMYGIENYDRAIINRLLKRYDIFDLVVPRGGEKLIQHVVKNSLIPIIKNDRGLCHAYVDAEADLDMAARIVQNAKMQRPGVCNSLESLLVHESIATIFLPKIFASCKSKSLQWRADKNSQRVLKQIPGAKPFVKLAQKKDWDTEYLDLTLNCKIVPSIDAALKHIETHGSKHSETIITKNEATARRFQNEVDAAAVYWNASTRFTDGYEFGLGGELGISTQKLHARGPVGVRELTTPRWVIDGNGQVRE